MNAPTQPPRDLFRSSIHRIAYVFSRDVDHAAVGQEVLGAGALNGGYLMMTAIAAAIATLGLLLSSPAVVIGAMLLSPLMGPIILLGFSFWTVDWGSTRKALASLGAALGLALLVSIGLTLVSPLKEPTAEILARAHPTLFDLLVAIFSGIAGGYAVVRQRGETVIGVAIATALMPPIAVVGFGIGTQAWSIAGGALLLFLTNLIAIALAAALVAAISGFRPEVHLARRGWLHHLAVLAILVGLCVPLTVSLRGIALESKATSAVRADVPKLFGAKARVTSLSAHENAASLEVDALVATQAFVESAPEKLQAELRGALHAPVQVNLDQVVVADPSKVKASLPESPKPNPILSALDRLKAAIPYAGAQVTVDPQTGTGIVMLSAQGGLDLAGARALELALRAHKGQEKTFVVPPVAPLPPIPITVTKGHPAMVAAGDPQRWALLRWRSQAVSARVCRHGQRGIRDKVVQASLDQSMEPLGVTLVQSPRDCPASGTPAVWVEPAAASAIVPGPAIPPARP